MKYNINRDKEIIEILDDDGIVLCSFSFSLLKILMHRDDAKDALMSIREMAIIRYSEKLDRGLVDMRLEVEKLLKEYKNNCSMFA